MNASRCIILLLFFTFEVASQGLIMDDDFYGSMPRQSVFGDGGKAELDALKGIHKNSLKPYCPAIQYQGAVSTCVGWSTGYGALTIQKAIQNQWTEKNQITDQAYSALFIFNQIKITDCGFGSRIGDALKLLKQKGNVLSKHYDTDKENCHKEITSNDLLTATDHRIMDFMTLFSSRDEVLKKINKTKLSLVQNKPVIIGMNVLNNFFQIPYRDSIWYPSFGDKSIFGGHAMVVVGFDDGLGAFEIMNSWGDTWANYGFVWVKYKDFAEYCRYGYQMILEKDGVKEMVYSTQFNLKKKVIQLTDGTILFKDEIPQFNGEYYHFKDKVFKRESIFQFVGSKLSEGIYLYVFSIDPDGDIKVHWPRDGNLDQKFEGIHESARIVIPNAELFFPSKTDAFLFDKSGKDIICILNATRPIENINQKLDQIRKRSGHPVQRLYQVFGKELVALNDINYTEKGMGFRSAIPKGKVVPLIVELEIGE